VCIPFDRQATIGDACQNLGDCTLGGFCIADAGAGGTGPRFPGGYCSDTCNPRGAGNACGNGNVCVAPDATRPDQGVCLDGCGGPMNGCRTTEGYVCQSVGGTRRACLPPPQ
jgi:hypothetical protein